MEDKGAAKDAIDSAKRWLGSARVNAGIGNYDSAIYSLEMSVEIALKAVLISQKADVPKTHAISDVVREVGRTGRRIPAEFKNRLDETIDVFNALLELRPTGGYMFETSLTLKELKVKYDEYVGSAGRAVALCEKAILASK